MARKKRTDIADLPLAKKPHSYLTEYFTESALNSIIEAAGGLAVDYHKKLKDDLEGMAGYLRAKLYMRNHARKTHRRSDVCMGVWAYAGDYFDANLKAGMSKEKAWKKALQQSGIKSQKDDVYHYVVRECARIWTNPYIFQKESPGITYKGNDDYERSGAFLDFTIAVLDALGIEGKTREGVAKVIKELKAEDKRKDHLFPEGLGQLNGIRRLEQIKAQEKLYASLALRNNK